MSQIKVEYINHMGSDLTSVNAARVSFGGTKTVLEDRDKKLIKYLAKHQHMSPFEHCILTVKITCPLYIRSQIHRHRTFSYNEISRRYTDKNMEFYLPDEYRRQSKNNKQASEGALSEEYQGALKVEVSEHHFRCLKMYEDMLSMGVCKEQARGILPQDLMTGFYMTGNLRNWVHFVKLRDHEGAQVEVQIIAKQVRELLLEKFGYSAEALLND